MDSTDALSRSRVASGGVINNNTDTIYRTYADPANHFGATFALLSLASLLFFSFPSLSLSSFLIPFPFPSPKI